MSRTISRSAARDGGSWFQCKFSGGSQPQHPLPHPHTGGDEGVAPLSEDLHEVVSEVTASQVETHDGMGQSIALIDGHVVGDSIPRIKDDAWEGESGKGWGSTASQIVPAGRYHTWYSPVVRPDA